MKTLAELKLWAPLVGALVVMAAVLGGGGYYVIKQTVDTLVFKDAQYTAEKWAKQFAQRIQDIESIARGESLSARDLAFVKSARGIGNVYHFMIFDAAGRPRLHSNEWKNEFAIGKLGDKPDPGALQVIRNGISLTVVERGDSVGDPVLYAESYFPVVKFGNTVAVVKVYVDQTEKQAIINRTFLNGSILLVVLCLTALAIPAIALFHYAQQLTLQAKLIEKSREIEIAHREADEAKKRAILADRAKSEFLANMSHEIRTPMNGVMGMAELLAKSELNAKQRTFADIILKSGASLLTIINDILDFSKIDAGQMELDPAPFRLSEAIEDVAALVSARVAEKDLELAVRIDPSLPDSVIGDVGRIRQIATNLIGNAVKFTEKGHVLVDVTGEVVPPNRPDREEPESAEPHSSGRRLKADTSSGRQTARLRFRIEDTGIGIPKEKCSTVFGKFSQVDNSASRKHEGTGLGLSIAASLVDMMGGEIGVDSEEGVGSTFWFNIELPVDTAGERSTPVPVDVSGSSVLIVDDNAVNRAILMEQMKAWRFDAAAASSGAEAIAVAESASRRGVDIDCIILDYHMPGMNGGMVATTLIEKARSGQLPSIPIVMLTSVDQTEDGRTFNSLQIAGHLAKPARSSLLLETIVQVMQDERDRKSGRDVHLGAISAARAMGEFSVGANPECDSRRKDPPLVSARTDQPKDGRPKQGSRSPEQGLPVPAGKEGPLSAPFDRPLHGIDILVCEDNEVNQVVFTQILQGEGYHFKLASNGREGIEIYRRCKPRLILMDVSMPEMSGLEAARIIRDIEGDTGVRTPIIGVTAHAIKGDKEKCQQAGMDDYLAKPISPDALAAKISRWLNRPAETMQAG